ncbi:MAG: response regulator [Rhodospirillaceae bacterium]
MNILLVEDSPEVSLSVREILASAGHDVDDAANGKEALAKLAEHSYDMVVSDIWMPEMDGISLLKEIRGAGNDVPVVVISGGAPNAPLTYTAPLASTFGAKAVVYKPFEKEELLKTIDAVMAGETVAPGEQV